jgi:hypothetical protein
MRFLSLSILFATLFFSSISSADDLDESENQCRVPGFLVLYNWYQLDTCLKYQGMKHEVALEARKSISKVYPKLQAEVEANSPLAARAKEAATSWPPYDFSDNQNSELLISKCNTSVGFLHLVSSSEDWAPALSCWR